MQAKDAARDERRSFSEPITSEDVRAVDDLLNDVPRRGTSS
jgi:hypothetical protein